MGALTADGTERAPFSNHGSWVDAWAPGQDVLSSFVTFDGPEDERPGADIDPDCFTGFATWSGTSFAAPQVAAAVAARAQQEKSSPRDVAQAVLDGYRETGTSAATGTAARRGAT